MRNRFRHRHRFGILFLFLFLSLVSSYSQATVKVGSKKFTESVILGEMATHLFRARGIEVTHRKELGGTRVLWSALKSGDIDIYPEYTGTLRQEILAKKEIKSFEDLRNALAEEGVGVTTALGFNDSYALGIKNKLAQELKITSISDLKKHGQLKFGFSNEFINRADGWPGLQKRYRLPQKRVTGLDHELAYAAMDAGKIDVTDLYSTDAEIEYHDLYVLRDNLAYFPEYQAVYVYRRDLAQKKPGAIETLMTLEGKINEEDMIAMNAQSKIKKVPEAIVASEFLNKRLNEKTTVILDTIPQNILFRTSEHLGMVALSLLAAILLSVPAGIVAAKRERLGQFILAITGVIQTIPSLALLVFLIPFFGIGTLTAMIALFLYSLLPIMRNTMTGLRDISPLLLESSEVLGLSRWSTLIRIELPLASRSILAGIKTSAVINVGTATLGAIIGAGGYGQPILTGIRLDDLNLILQGAVPAALMALAVQLLFDWLEGRVVPKGLRIRAR